MFVRLSRIRVAVAVVVLSLAGCSKTRDPWPEDEPDINTLKLTEAGVEASPELVRAVRVEPTRLVLPAEKADEVRAAWPVGKAVIGAPSSMPGTTNPLGFLRKVKEVRVEGADVIVETEAATLDEVMDGQLRLTVDANEMSAPETPGGMDLSPYLPSFPTNDATPWPDDIDALGFSTSPLGGDPTRDPPTPLLPVNQKRQPLELTAETISTPQIPIPLNVNADRPIAFTDSRGQLTSANMNYRGSFKVTPSFSLTPRVKLNIDTKLCPFCQLETFLFSVGGSIGSSVKIDADVSVNPSANDAARLSTTDLKRLDDAVDIQPVQFKLPDFEVGPKYTKKVGSVYGVPVLLVAGVTAECQFKVRGDYKGSLDLSMNNPNFVVGVKYTDQGDKKNRWAPISPEPFVLRGAATIVNATGTVELECGLTLKSSLTLGGLVGPYVGLKNMLVAESTFAQDACPTDAPAALRAKGTVVTALKAYSEVEVGAEVTLLKVISFGAGPYVLGRVEYAQGASTLVPENQIPLFWSVLYPGTKLYYRPWIPLWQSAPQTFQRDGICPSLCVDSIKNNTETDVDCGGNCGPTCVRGKVCTRNDDCLSRVCTSGVCRGGLSDDGVVNQGETDVDCGGPTNPNRCTLQQVCARTSDCGEGFCSPSLLKCSNNLCEDGVKSGNEGDVDCGGSQGCSSKCQTGLGCNADTDCVSGACSVNGVCVADKCVDGLRSGDEGGVDCGGSCPNRCALGAGCDVNRESDCASGICSTNGSVCVATRCADGRFNQDETDIDCGGSICSARCAPDRYCAVSGDCQAGSVCSGKTNRCVTPGCGDGLKNLNETGIDCGGPTCDKCGLSKGCLSGTDCASGVCSNSRCVVGLCDNAFKDPGEADVDCGGTCSGLKCATGKTCTQAADCLSNICAGNVCTSDPCIDRVRNGTETDVDCGGTCAADCALGKVCSVNADCASGLCSAGLRCVASACSDGVKNNSETDVDCGGTCAAKCAINKTCTANADCDSTVCNLTTGRCVPDTCFDGVKNGSETDLDCGGTCQPKCGVSKVCSAGSDCQSGSCTVGNTCASDQCSDGQLNGNESAIDCGGTCATKCAVGQGCLTGDDCVNPGMVGIAGYCNVNTRTCTSSSCGDGVQNGNETGLDCGGSCGACGVGQGCTSNSNCSSNQCNFVTGLCVADSCSNGRVDIATETDVDCGSGCATKCAVGQGCNGGGVSYYGLNCQSGYCTAGLCSPRVPQSCLELYNQGVRTNGPQQLDMDGPMRCGQVGCGGGDPQNVYCDMTGGGWTLVYALNQQWATTANMDSFGRNAANCAPAGCAHPQQYAIDTPVFSSFATRHTAFGLAPSTAWSVLKWEGYTSPTTMRLQTQEIPRSSLRFALGNGTSGYGYVMWGNPYYWLVSNDNWLSGAWTQPAGDAPVPLSLDQKTAYWGTTFGNGFAITTVIPGGSTYNSRGFGMWAGGPNGAMGMCNSFSDSCLFLPGFNGNYQNIQDSRLVMALWAR